MVRTLIFPLVIAFLLGSLPFGLWICRFKGIGDPRVSGSGSSGATNVGRLLGPFFFFLVMILDVAKGTLAVAFCLSWGGVPPVMAVGAAVLGHVYSPFASWKGGKGVATTAGGMLLLVPKGLFAAVVVFLLLFLLFRRISLASLTGAIALPILVWVFGEQTPIFRMSLVLFSAFLCWTHRENISRLLQGKERQVEMVNSMANPMTDSADSKDKDPK
jgi:acyl phosphate:glycerol-3-phosphate acyltransferase